MAAALVGDAQGSCAGSEYSGPGRSTCAGALLRWLGSNAPNCIPGQNTPGPVL